LYPKAIWRRGTASVLLLFLLSFAIISCGSASSGDAPNSNGSETAQTSESAEKPDTEANEEPSEPPDTSGGETVESITPEDVLSEDELGKGAPERRDWDAPTNAEVVALPGTEDSSVGAIPAVKPFNFGRDPGGPEDKTMYLTIPKLGLTDVPVYNEISEENLTASTVHHPSTGFPWQQGANTFIAGHRIGYEGTGSWQIFYDVPSLVEGDEVILTDSEGEEYVYQITGQETVGTDNVQSMNPVEGKSVISLQTCTLPDYSERIIVQGELVEGDAV
jgi:sortase A